MNIMNRPTTIVTKAKAEETVAYLNAEEARDVANGDDDGTGWTYRVGTVNAARGYYRIDIVDADGRILGAM